jgi:hypothetical protein
MVDSAAVGLTSHWGVAVGRLLPAGAERPVGGSPPLGGPALGSPLFGIPTRHAVVEVLWGRRPGVEEPGVALLAGLPGPLYSIHLFASNSLSCHSAGGRGRLQPSVNANLKEGVITFAVAI